MGLFDFFTKKKVDNTIMPQNQPISQQQSEPKMQKNTQEQTQPSNLFTQPQLKELIEDTAKLSYMFKNSTALKASGGGRNEKMMSRLHSYAGILGYFYEVVYKYGSYESIVDSKMAAHYLLVKNALSDESHRRKTVNELADNWSDVLQTIFYMKLDETAEGKAFRDFENNTAKITKAMEKLSGKKCREPKNEMKNAPRKVSYNPYRITEDLQLSQGHCIPDLTSVFVQDILEIIVTMKERGENPKAFVVDYTVNLIKSYYDNAGYVPMVIVRMITGQVDQVVDMAGGISYTPFSSLKELVLSKIYY